MRKVKFLIFATHAAIHTFFAIFEVIKKFVWNKTLKWNLRHKFCNTLFFSYYNNYKKNSLNGMEFTNAVRNIFTRWKNEPLYKNWTILLSRIFVQNLSGLANQSNKPNQKLESGNLEKEKIWFMLITF